MLLRIEAAVLIGAVSDNSALLSIAAINATIITIYLAAGAAWAAIVLQQLGQLRVQVLEEAGRINLVIWRTAIGSKYLGKYNPSNAAERDRMGGLLIDVIYGYDPEREGWPDLDDFLERGKLFLRILCLMCSGYPFPTTPLQDPEHGGMSGSDGFSTSPSPIDTTSIPAVRRWAKDAEALARSALSTIGGAQGKVRELLKAYAQRRKEAEGIRMWPPPGTISQGAEIDLEKADQRFDPLVIVDEFSKAMTQAVSIASEVRRKLALLDAYTMSLPRKGWLVTGLLGAAIVATVGVILPMADSGFPRLVAVLVPAAIYLLTFGLMFRRLVRSYPRREPSITDVEEGDTN